MDPARWYISGMQEWLRNLGVAPERLKAAEKSFRLTAGLTVQVWAKELARSQGGVAGKAAADVRAGGPGIVRYGGRPYDMGAEFGSYQYRQFETWRGKDDDAGYFFWPSIRKFRDSEMLNVWLHESWKALGPAFGGK